MARRLQPDATHSDLTSSQRGPVQDVVVHEAGGVDHFGNLRQSPMALAKLPARMRSAARALSIAGAAVRATSPAHGLEPMARPTPTNKQIQAPRSPPCTCLRFMSGRVALATSKTTRGRSCLPPPENIWLAAAISMGCLWPSILSKFCRHSSRSAATGSIRASMDIPATGSSSRGTDAGTSTSSSAALRHRRAARPVPGPQALARGARELQGPLGPRRPDG